MMKTAPETMAESTMEAMMKTVTEAIMEAMAKSITETNTEHKWKAKSAAKLVTPPHNKSTLNYVLFYYMDF